MKRTTPFLLLAAALSAAALLAPPAAATILVQDSFDAGGYSIGTGLKNLNPGNTTGFTSKTWGTSSSTGVFFVNGGLTFPNDFTASAAGNAIGVGYYYNSGSSSGGDPAGNNKARRISRTIDNDVIPASGTYYFRFACQIGASAEKFLSKNDFEALGLTPQELVNTTGIGMPPNIGIHIGFSKTADQNKAGTDIALWIAGTKKATLASNITAGKTYLVVAKIEVAADGTASVSALAGATDAPALRSASLPAPVTENVGTSALRHLCISGVYMTNHFDSDKYATFDEVAIGTTLDDVWGFTVAGAPVVAATCATAVGETGFTANGTLSDLGASDPDLFFDLSDDDGATWTPASMGTYSATGDIAHNATGLLPGATYLWRFRAEGATLASTSTVQSVTLAGAPVLDTPAAAVADNAATLSVALTAPGLSGAAATTVELWFAAAGEPLALEKTFPTVTAAADFSETVSNLVWGASYDYAFRATVPAGGRTLETWTDTISFTVSGDIAWTAGAGTTDWHTAGNWNPAIVPGAALNARFAAVGGDVTAEADAVAATVSVNTTGAGTTFDFGEHALSGGYLFVGGTASGSRLTLGEGDYSFTSNRVGWTNARQSTLVVGDGAVLAGNDIFVGTDNDLTASSNAVVFAPGSATRLAGSLQLRAARGTRVDVESGASLTVNRLEFLGCDDRMVVDGGSFTNNGATILFRSNQRGDLAETMFLELRNGADAKMNGNVYVNAGKNHGGALYHAELRVLDGSVFDMTGKDLLIDTNSGDAGPGSDAGAGAAVIVSNATLRAQAISVGIDDRHYGDSLRIYEDDGCETVVSASANARIGSGTWTRSGNFNRDHFVLVEGGAFSVAGTLFVGDGGQYYATHANNRIAIKSASARVSVGNLTVYGKSRLDFEIPAGGFDQVPFQVTGTASFGTIPVQGDNKVPMYQEGEWDPVSEIRVDATKFTGKQTLLTAASITGLTEDRVVVAAPKSTFVKVVVSETSVTVTVPAATVLIIR